MSPPPDQDHVIETRRVGGGDDPQDPQTMTENPGSETSPVTREGQEAGPGQNQEDRAKGRDLGRGRRENTRRNVTKYIILHELCSSLKSCFNFIP